MKEEGKNRKCFSSILFPSVTSVVISSLSLSVIFFFLLVEMMQCEAVCVAVVAFVMVAMLGQPVQAGACAGACQPKTDYCPSSYKSGEDSKYPVNLGLHVNQRERERKRWGGDGREC